MNSILFGAECSCGRKLTCIQTSPLNIVTGDSISHVWRIKPEDALAELERVREHIDGEIGKLKR